VFISSAPHQGHRSADWERLVGSTRCTWLCEVENEVEQLNPGACDFLASLRHFGSRVATSITPGDGAFCAHGSRQAPQALCLPVGLAVIERTYTRLRPAQSESATDKPRHDPTIRILQIAYNFTDSDLSLSLSLGYSAESSHVPDPAYSIRCFQPWFSHRQVHGGLIRNRCEPKC
jgi:hypothetical protein